MSNEKEAYLSFVMPFGEHQGKELRDVPIDYLRFLIRKGIGEGTLKNALEYFEDVIDTDDEWFVWPTLGEVA